MVSTVPSPLVASAAGGSVEINPAHAHRGWLRHVAALSNHRPSTWLLAAVAFADSSFLPIPPDLLLIPMSLMRPERPRFLMVVCIAASSLGAVLGYLIGWGLWSTIGVRLVEFYGCEENFAAFQHLVAEWGVPVIIVKAFTPIPFKIAAIAAGVAAMNPFAFMTATIVGRALHFGMVALLLVLFGARLMTLVSRYERKLAIVSIVAAIGVAVFWYLR
jgi:membrane protein YqaA with SNARE-associated domain